MQPNHHPDISTLLAYSAGSVTEGFALLIAAHLESCMQCRKIVSQADTVGASLLSNLPQTRMSDRSLKNVWQRIDNNITFQEPAIVPDKNADIPTVLSEFIPNGLNNLKWRNLVPGIKHYPVSSLESGNGTVRILHITKGVCIPDHSHTGSELTLILQGSYSDETGQYTTGDLSDTDSTVKHKPVVDSDEPCICLIATDDKLVFDGSFNRILQTFIGI